jgi:hypothetical protein
MFLSNSGSKLLAIEVPVMNEVRPAIRHCRLGRSPSTVKRWLRESLLHFLFIGRGARGTTRPTRHLVAAALLLQCATAAACPLCMGWGQPSKAEQLVTAPQVVLAVPTADADHFRVIQVIKGERPADGTVEGGYPRSASPVNDATPTDPKPLLLVRNDPFPTWVILGAIDASRADWLRALATGKRAGDMSSEEWAARVALVVPHLDDPEPLAVDLAYAELKAAPYAALRAAKQHLDVAALRRWLADPDLAARWPMCLLLLGVSGNVQDADALERRLQAALQSGDAANLSSLLAADLELRGVERVAWIESNYLADPKRSSAEIKAALLALSVHGTTNGAIPREQVIQSYRLFMKKHPEIAGDVAPYFATWQYWDAVPDYLTLMKSRVRQQYPSRLAMLAYLQQSPNAKALGFTPEAAPADGKADRWNPSLPQL